VSPLKRGPAGILQLNIGLYCNQVLKLRSSALLVSAHDSLDPCPSTMVNVTSMSRRPAKMQYSKYLSKRPPRDKCIPANQGLAIPLAGVQPLPRGELTAAHRGDGPRHSGPSAAAAAGGAGHRAHARHHRRRPRAQPAIQVRHVCSLKVGLWPSSDLAS